MNIPIVSPDEIKITEVRPTANDTLVGIYRLVASLRFDQTCSILRREESGLRFSLRDEAARLMKTRIMRRMYPVEIRKEIGDIKQHFCGMPDSYLRRDVARDLYDRLSALEAALQPQVK